MIKNYKVDHASARQPELQLLSTVGSINTWRVYFDIFEHEDERKTETISVIEKTPITKTYEDPETGETIEYTDYEDRIVEKEITIEHWEAKFIEIKKSKYVNTSALDLIKEYVINEITDYDLSTEVNGFYLNGTQVWLDRDTRVSLMNSTSIQKNAGLSTTVLWLGTHAFEIDCDLAIQLLGGLEIYALGCFNKTAEHKKNVEELETVDEVAQYDYTAGYPEKLEVEV